MEEKKTRVHRTVEQHLADLEKKQAEVIARQRAAIAKIEEEKKRLLQTPSVRKDKVDQEKRFARAVYVLAPEWDYRHFIAAVEIALNQSDASVLAERGEALLEEHGKARRGRRPKNG